MKTIRELFGGLGNQMFQHAYIFAQMRRGEIPDIYLQNEEYFEDYKDEIKALYKAGTEKSDYISLHIRRGDYVGNPFYVDLCATDYYDKAIAMFPNEKFLVFCADRQPISNDGWDRLWAIEYLKKKLPEDRFDLFEGENEIEDMNAMAGCKARIGANSSFSWWACYLGEGKNVMPSVKNWYTDGVERTKCPSDWIRI